MTIFPRKLIACATLSVGALLTPSLSSAQALPLDDIGAQFWQWALSIPHDQNPLIPTNDARGESCFIGQRGHQWFLNTGWFYSAPINRHCDVPEGVTLYFPVYNFVNVSVPKCDGVVQTEQELRDAAAPAVDSIVKYAVTLDGHNIPTLGRQKSSVFSLVFPKNDLFTTSFSLPDCIDVGRVYPTAIDDGIYAKVHDLDEGKHTLHIYAEKKVEKDVNGKIETSIVTAVDTTYTLYSGPRKPDRR
jgi:hypothetical protein